MSIDSADPTPGPHDPHEGVDADGNIVTGARRDRVPAPSEPVLAGAIESVGRVPTGASLYVYGSVATGTATVPASDVDLMTIGLSEAQASALSRRLTTEFAGLCRSVDVGPAQLEHYLGDGDEAYGNRVFLRHYCVHLCGPDRHSHLPPFPADAAAARGFNGDIARHAAVWREALDRGDDPPGLGRRIGRKTLLAVAGLVSVHDHTWTTDRSMAAARWGEIEPIWDGELAALQRWSRGDAVLDRTAVSAALDGIVAHVVERFDRDVGLWRD